MKFYLKGAIMVCGLVILANTIGALIQTKEKHNANILLNANFMTTYASTQLDQICDFQLFRFVCAKYCRTTGRI